MLITGIGVATMNSAPQHVCLKLCVSVGKIHCRFVSGAPGWACGRARQNAGNHWVSNAVLRSKYQSAIG